MENKDLCDICSTEFGVEQSMMWCHDCEQKLCSECKDHHDISNGTKYHCSVALSDYLKLPGQVREISTFCVTHNEVFELYCKKHGRVCCSRCFLEDHKKCRDIADLYQILSNIKHSISTDKVLDAVDQIRENIEKSSEHSINYLKSLSEETKQVKAKVQELISSKSPNKSLSTLIEKSTSFEENESKKCRDFLTSIKDHEGEIESYQKMLKGIIEYASDIQVFISIDGIQKDIIEKQRRIRSTLENFISEHYSLSLKVTNNSHDLPNTWNVEISKKPNEIFLKWDDDKTVLYGFQNAESIKLENIQLELIKTLNIDTKYNTGCLISRDGKFVFASGFDNVTVLDRQGNLEFKVEASTFDIAHGIENNTVVLSSGFACTTGNHCVTFIDLQERRIMKTISVSSEYFGIANMKNRFICATQYSGIKMEDTSFVSNIDIVPEVMHGDSYLAFFGEKIYHSESETHSVICYNLNGERLWAFRNQSVLYHPMGIDVDCSGNTYVVGCTSCNLVVISPDGQHYKEILSERDGLIEPRAIYLDKSNKEILITNLHQNALLYSIKTTL